MKLFPNPTAGKFQIQLPNSDLNRYRATIYNMYGQLVSSKNIDSQQNVLDLSHEKKGVYSVVITDGYNNQPGTTLRVVVE